MPSIRRVFGFGQVIDSVVDVPGALPLGPRDTTAAEFTVRYFDPTDDVIGPAGLSRYGEELRLEIPGVASYHCRTREIAITSRRGTSHGAPSALGDYLIATALPAALWMQGRLMLHAAAVCNPPGGRALGLMGRSGSGKSPLAAGFVARGALLLADDSIAIALAPGGPIGSGLPGGLFLRGEHETRQFRPLARHQTIDAAQLGALVVLDPTAAESRLTRLPPTRAIEAVLSHRHRPRAPDLLGMQARVLRDCTVLLRTVPVFAWRRPNAIGLSGPGGAEPDEADRLMRALIDENFGS
ncbi:MAG: hypothetical protein WBD53_04770 [Xanthobacteraceae bacterium]